MNFRSKIKKGFLAIFAFALISGATVKAHAIVINPNDLVLVLYGNSTEYYQNITPTTDAGPAPGVFSIGASGVSAAGPIATTQWALVSWQFTEATGPTTINFAGKGNPTEGFTDLVWNNLASWSSLISNVSTNPNNATISTTAQQSYTSNVDNFRDGTMNGAFPAGTGFGNYGQTLEILSGDFNTLSVTPTGRTANLSLDGLGGAILTIASPAPVPLPASLVLFASGLVGLIGVARRKLIAA